MSGTSAFRSLSRLSFRWRAILGIALIEALTLSITIFGALGQMERTQSDLIERSARTALSLFSAAVSDALIASDIAKVEAVSQDLLSRNEAVFVRVLDRDGREVAARGNATELARTFRNGIDPLDDTHGSYAVSSFIMAGSERIGEVQLGIDNRQAGIEIAQAKRLAAVVATIGMSLAALFSWLLGSWLAAGIHRLSDGARRIASGGLDARVDENIDAELSSLARTFNTMAASLQVREAEREELLSRAEQAVQDAREASRAKSAFLAAMSHEIRTPLNGVVGLARIIADNHRPDLVREFSAQLGIAAGQLRMIVNDILDFSKIEAGKLDLENVAFAITDVMETCRAAFSAEAQDKGLDLIAEVAPDVPPALRGDRTRLIQILSNYASNGLKFTDSGRVDIRIDLLERAGERVRLRLSVRDTGRGVSREEVDALFEPFVQADASIVRSHGGTGLGLTICKRLAEAMGGCVGGEGQPGKGALFWADVWLDVASANELSTLREGADAEALANLRVLVVDDVAVNRMVARHLLARSGAHVEEAENGLQAVERVCVGGIDVVLMDIQMPVMDGKTATREIIARLGLKAPPVVALTAHALAEERNECLALGMRDYLTKPVDMQALLISMSNYVPVIASGSSTHVGEQLMSPDSAPTDGKPVLDTSKVHAQFDGDFDLYREILAVTVDEVKAMRESLHDHLGDTDEQLIPRVHALKGVALNLCFARAGMLAVALERGLRDASLQAAEREAALSAFVESMVEAEAVAREYLETGRAR